MKLLITGHGRHGKDTTCELLRDHFGLTFVSSSLFVAQRAVMPYLRRKGIVYDSLEACYADRHRDNEMRAIWYDAICEFNKHDRAKLGRELFAEHDIYAGLRNREEFRAMRLEKMWDASIWVDRSKHLPPEPETSMTIKPSDCDYILDNNGSLADLGVNIARLYISILTAPKKA